MEHSSEGEIVNGRQLTVANKLAVDIAALFPSDTIANVSASGAIEVCAQNFRVTCSGLDMSPTDGDPAIFLECPKNSANCEQLECLLARIVNLASEARNSILQSGPWDFSSASQRLVYTNGRRQVHCRYLADM